MQTDCKAWQGNKFPLQGLPLLPGPKATISLTRGLHNCLVHYRNAASRRMYTGRQFLPTQTSLPSLLQPQPCHEGQ